MFGPKPDAVVPCSAPAQDVTGPHDYPAPPAGLPNSMPTSDGFNAVHETSSLAWDMQTVDPALFLPTNLGDAQYGAWPGGLASGGPIDGYDSGLCPGATDAAGDLGCWTASFAEPPASYEMAAPGDETGMSHNTRAAEKRLPRGKGDDTRASQPSRAAIVPTKKPNSMVNDAGGNKGEGDSEELGERDEEMEEECDEDEDEEDEEGEPSGADPRSRVKMLARNRAAASRSRTKKKKWVHRLEDNKMDLEARNTKLQRQHASLVQEVIEAKGRLMTHAGCNDGNIDEWIGREAKKFVDNKVGVATERSKEAGGRRTAEGGGREGGKSSEGEPSVRGRGISSSTNRPAGSSLSSATGSGSGSGSGSSLRMSADG